MASPWEKYGAPKAKPWERRAQSQPPAPPPSAGLGGMGGFNPVLGRLMGAQQAVTEPLGMTAENTKNPVANAAGPLEAVAQAGTGLGGMIAGGLAGLGQGAKNIVSPGMPAADRVEQVQNAITYQPRTGMGAGSSAVAGAPGALYDQGTTKAGEFTADVTGSPAAGAAVKTVLSAAPIPKLARALPKRGPKDNYKPAEQVVPSTEQLNKAATEAYKKADESGIAIKAESFEKMKGELVAKLEKDGINAKLHPKATAALEELTNTEGPVSLQKAETLRRIASDAMDTLEKSDARKSGMVIDAIDDYIDNLTDADLVSGDPAHAASLKEARALYTRKRKSEDMERLIERAKLAPSGFGNGLLIEFRALAKNDRKMKRFTAEEQKAIKRVAMGGGLAENALRLIGKAAPTGIVSGALGSGAGAVLLGPAGAVAVPAAGFAARKAAENMTRRNAERAAVLMRRGKPSGGLLTTDNPKPLTGGPQAGSEAGQSAAKPRSVREIQAELRQLSARAPFELAKESAGSPKVRAFAAELARLQRELEATPKDQ